jgi:hypothetical protein
MSPDARHEARLCESTDVGAPSPPDEVDRFKTVCGGVRFVEQHLFFSISWELDASGELVSASPATSDVAEDCPAPGYFGAEPCDLVSNVPEVLCKDFVDLLGDGGAGGQGGAGGAGGAP